MIYVTGDTHGQIDISKLFPGSFPDGKGLTRDDYMIICGDFGGVWFGDERDDTRMAWWQSTYDSPEFNSFDARTNL